MSLEDLEKAMNDRKIVGYSKGIYGLKLKLDDGNTLKISPIATPNIIDSCITISMDLDIEFIIKE